MFGGLLYIMQEIKVNNIIIGKQYKSSENYEEFIKIVKEKKINVKIVEGGEKVSIEDNLYFDIIWPFSDNMISDNSINNNSLVCKLNYKNYSMLFTGDIEAIAEKAILKKYSKNLNILKSDILKVAHHGSKTSSITEFIEKIKPKYAIIGVGEDNKFGHPSDSTIQNLEKANIRIYRTDKMGEIEIKTNGKEIKINEFLKCK
jgi:competence protein ComEC